jgi:hypothetical protein
MGLLITTTLAFSKRLVHTFNLVASCQKKSPGFTNAPAIKELTLEQNTAKQAASIVYSEREKVGRLFILALIGCLSPQRHKVASTQHKTINVLGTHLHM